MLHASTTQGIRSIYFIYYLDSCDVITSYYIYNILQIRVAMLTNGSREKHTNALPRDR